jgi:primosomal protein N' (replication factor Y)
MIYEIAVPTPLRGYFDYLPPLELSNQNLIIGMRVRVPFGKRNMIGMIVGIKEISALPAAQLKPITEVIDAEPILSDKLLELVRWASDYYHHSLGEVLFTALPVLLRKGKAVEGRVGKAQRAHQAMVDGEHSLQLLPTLQLNINQQAAIDVITSSLHHFQTFLLHGVTGSGKTEVYLQVIEQVLAQQKQALILVPEIGLTPQTIARFRERFAVPIVALHSALTDRERLIAWSSAKTGEAAIIIGTRSAVFTPLAKPGVIIIDEEHDLSFKQQDGFRYNARDLAVMRGRLENIPVVLGSATPALESFYNAEQQRYQLLSLPARVNAAALPNITVIDIRNQKLNNGLSTQLLTAIEKHLADNGQVLLFVNRRGFAPLLLCQACGWIASCTRCDSKLVYHHQPPMLQCHHCTQTRAIDKHCPVCQSHALAPIGLGTQRIEQVLTQHFPDVGMVRIDRDSTRRKGALHTMLDEIHDGKHRILLGTQMITKGHHFPELTLVAVLDADVGLFSADFRAAEHAAQLLLQVAGRAGRADRIGEVVIQTYNPQHVLLQELLTQDYARFAQTVLQERRAACLPPFNHFAMLRAEATSKEQPLLFLKQVRTLAQHKHIADVDLLGPIPSLIERKAGRYRAQLLLQAPQRSALHKMLTALIKEIPTLPAARRVRWSLDVDPQETI